MNTTKRTSITLIAALVALVVLSAPTGSLASSDSALCAVQGSGRLEIDGKKIKWGLTNETYSPVWIEDLMIEWPEANGSIKKIKLSGDIVKHLLPAPTYHFDGIWDGNLGDREIKDLDTKVLEIEFENDVDPVTANYFIEADFGSGCSVVMKPLSAECPVRGSGLINFDNEKVKWSVTNDSDSTVYLQDLRIGWPEINSELVEVKFGGSSVYNTVTPAPSLNVATQWVGKTDDRKIDSTKAEQLELKFSYDAEPIADRYYIEAVFNDDCSLIFTPNGKGAPGVTPADFSAVIGADLLHSRGLTGQGVTVAIVDTGVWHENRLKKNRHDDERILNEYNVIKGEQGKDKAKDKSGHGTHVTSLIANSERWENGLFAGVAPDADLLVVQAFDENGSGRYSEVIRGLDWILQNTNTYDIRVVNLSFSAEPRSYYWDDPLNQAVMALWEAGIVVVASAGNSGPDPMTIGVPGNIPYVITVGAMSDAVTPDDHRDDFLASFSAAGPTYEGFIKPEIVAPGGHLRGVMDKKGRIAENHPNFMTAASTSPCPALRKQLP